MFDFKFMLHEPFRANLLIKNPIIDKKVINYKTLHVSVGMKINTLLKILK